MSIQKLIHKRIANVGYMITEMKQLNAKNWHKSYTRLAGGKVIHWELCKSLKCGHSGMHRS